MERKFYRPGNDQTKKKKSSFWLKTGRFFVFLLLLGTLAFFSLFFYFAKDLPDPQKISSRQVAQSTKIYDRTGKILLYDIHGEEKRTVVPFDEISENLKKATLAAEDAGFYQHKGIELTGILRGIYKTYFKKEVAQSGSTITQQLIKLSFLSAEKTFSRKIKEIILAIEMERKYSKDEILGFYLNQIPYGSNAYGAEAASQLFFGKRAKDLTLAQAAVLAAMPKAPSYYSPYGNHVEDLMNRKDYILSRISETNMASKEEVEAAKQEKIEFSRINQDIKAPHFVMYVRDYLNERYGESFVEKAGYSVYTTLDWDMQQTGEEIISKGAAKNEKSYGASNAALLALDPKTGQILTMVGSRDYFDTKHDGNVNVTIRERSPGSSFKPFVYAKAFEKGLTPQTLVFDLPTEFNQYCPWTADQEKDQYGLDCYHPQNYNETFSGPVSLKEALAQSLNVPAVKVMYLTGVEDSIDFATKLGLTTLKDKKRYGLALVLGGGEVKLVDMALAYSVFSQDGKKHKLSPVLKITDDQGNTVEEFKNSTEQIINENTARLITDILSDNTARTPVFGPASPLYFKDFTVAAKTGTTQEYRDAWVMGYTPELVAGVWAGNNNNKPMSKGGAGIMAAGPLWHDFMEKALTNNIKNHTAFIPPQKPEPTKAMINGSLVNKRMAKIDKISGLLATPQTPPNLVVERSFNQIHSILYYIDRSNILGPDPEDPSKDPLFENWERPVLNWIRSTGNSNFGMYNQFAPTQYDNVHIPENKPLLKITKPSENDELNKTGYNFVEIEASANLGLKQADFFLDDVFLGSSYRSPFSFNFLLPKQIDQEKIDHFLKVRIYDEAQNTTEETVPLVIKSSFLENF
jgi:1A family penicillin-binding protein